MKKNMNNVKVDVEYLSSIVKNSGLTYREFAESIGRARSFVRNTIDRGYMQVPAAKLLCKVYNVDFDKLVISEKQNENQS